MGGRSPGDATACPWKGPHPSSPLCAEERTCRTVGLWELKDFTSVGFSRHAGVNLATGVIEPVCVPED